MSPIIVALDFDRAEKALNFTQQLDPTNVRVKVGSELFVNAGPAIVEKLQYQGFDVFLDLKFHDIPNTVAKACLASAELGVWMTNIHASGGAPMMRHVMTTLENHVKRPLIIAVSVLTSMDAPTLAQIGVPQALDKQVVSLATLAKTCGLDGMVCSALEAKTLKSQLGKDFKLITPGIRLDGDCNDDQTRIMTPERALAAGSDYLVIGRSITQSKKPLQTIDDILTRIV